MAVVQTQPPETSLILQDWVLVGCWGSSVDRAKDDLLHYHFHRHHHHHYHYYRHRYHCRHYFHSHHRLRHHSCLCVWPPETWAVQETTPAQRKLHHRPMVYQSTLTVVSLCKGSKVDLNDLKLVACPYTQRPVNGAQPCYHDNWST